MDRKNLFVQKEENGKFKKTPIVVCGVLLILCIVVIVSITTSKSGEREIISESSLKEIFEIGELSTIEYIYNSTVTVKENKIEKYHVAYEGVVTAGVDFDKIQIKDDKTNKKLIVTIPNSQITSIKVNEKKLDYIFIKEKYNTEDVFQEAYNACVKDLEKKARSHDTIMEMAESNALSTITALFKPFEFTLPEGYKIEYQQGEIK